MVELLYFAGLKEIVGREREQLPVQSLSVQELLGWVRDTYSGFPSDPGAVLVAVNEEYAQLDDKITAGDVVAFIPPVSGG